MSADGREVWIDTNSLPPSDPLDTYRMVFPGASEAFEKRGRATGWREAIEALRAEAAARRENRPVESLDLRRAADFLESLAPKETP